MLDARYLVRRALVAAFSLLLVAVIPGCPDAPSLAPTDAPRMDGAPPDATPDAPGMDDAAIDVPMALDGGDAGPAECVLDTDCTTADMCQTARCDAGRCVRTPVDCGDSDPCTDDVCDGLTGACSNPPSADGSACGTGECCSGACVDPLADPANCGGCGMACGANATCGTGACVCDSGFLDCDAAPGCEVPGATDPFNCGACGTTCAAPTPSCLGGACGACASASDCADDGLACTGTPTCTSGVCAYPVTAGSCLVAGGCYAAGTASPTDPCFECDPTMSSTAFSPRPGARCDDGIFCTDADVCDASGGCAGVSRSCDDGLTCTTDTCNESLDRCDNRALAARCVIDGACWLSGDPNPANAACQVCNPASEAYAWSALVGAACDDGNFCTVTDSCTSAGLCDGPTRACSDGFSCTVDACDEFANACVNPVDKGGCLIAGVCYAMGARNPANACEVCDSSRAQDAWSANDGGSCDDGSFCTVSDTCDSVAGCVGVPRVCDDGLSCTSDACNETSDRCDVIPAAGFCAIDGACRAEGTRNPTNDCQACMTAMAVDAWSPRTGQTCDDTLFCTQGDACSAAGTCGGSARSCDDTVSCTVDSCDESANACASTLAAGSCAIGGVCYPAGAINPANQCEGCVPGTSTSAWTVRTAGSCDDGLFCTMGDVCSAAALCAGTARVCDDALSCTTDSCNEGQDRCDNAIQAGFCAIDGACRANGAQNPAEACQACDTGASTTAWTARTGAACADGLFCTDVDTCTAAGTCGGTARDCADANGCTLDTCNEGTDACDHSTAMGFCTIAATCYAAGARNPADQCEVCDPAVSSSAWSAATGATCDDGLFCTVADSCNGAGVCAGSTRSCADSAACTTDTCNEGADRCDNVVVAGSCLVSGSCVAEGAIDPANSCQSCQTAVSNSAFSPRTGAACNDGFFCTLSDACTAAATCTGAANPCSDGLSCTTDTCDETSDACVATVGTGCLIGGACYASGAVNAANACEACDPSRSRTSWTASVGAACDDGLFCTTGDVCSASATCGGGARSCADALSCTVDTCDEGANACVNTLAAGSCAIGGTCYPNGSINPSNFCQACMTASSTSAWTARTGTACDDGLFCTVSEACTAAATCVGAARSCSDGLSCTTDSCSESSDVCTNPVAAGNCLISGTCHAQAEVNPGNQCEACETSSSTTAWTPRTGASCDDGLYCTVSDACNGSASCVGVARTCADTYSCTADSCNEAMSTCQSSLMAGFCLISGGCYTSAQLDPGNQCQLCSPGTSTSAWTPRTGAACSDGLFCTVSETCSAAAVCSGSARDCSDPHACTTDSCDEAADACENTLNGGCLIGAACYADGAVDPGNACQECNPSVSTTAWTARTGVSCADGLFCTVGDVCSATGACSGSPRVCSDGLSCTSDSCNEGADTCDAALMAGFCSIAGACYASGTVNPANACQICTPASSTTTWTARTGTRCDDGSVAGCGMCNGSGTCATSTTCSDGAGCTTDTCNDSTGACSFMTTAMDCVIGGTCYAMGTVNPTNPCQICAPSSSSTSWTPNTGARCNDGAAAGCGVCNGSSVCATATTCSDGLSCTTDACDDPTGMCSQMLNPGFCSIAAACYANGTVNPAQACQVCDTSMSTSAWTPRTGTRCDDMSVAGCGMCNGTGMCATSSTCSDPLACTTNTCMDTTGACSFPTTPDSCAISGACYAMGTVNPANSCQVCDPAMSTTAWSARVGARCDDGAPAGCGLCNGSGVCATGTTCSDGLSCTGDSCNDNTGACSFSVTTGCLIAGACYANAAVNPANPCQVCTPATSTTAWSPRPLGTTCSTDGNSATCETCNASGVCTVVSTCSPQTCRIATCNSPGSCSYATSPDNAPCGCGGSDADICCGGNCRSADSDTRCGTCGNICLIGSCTLQSGGDACVATNWSCM